MQWGASKGEPHPNQKKQNFRPLKVSLPHSRDASTLMKAYIRQ